MVLTSSLMNLKHFFSLLSHKTTITTKTERQSVHIAVSCVLLNFSTESTEWRECIVIRRNWLSTIQFHSELVARRICGISLFLFHRCALHQRHFGSDDEFWWAFTIGTTLEKMRINSKSKLKSVVRIFYFSYLFISIFVLGYTLHML